MNNREDEQSAADEHREQRLRQQAESKAKKSIKQTKRLSEQESETLLHELKVHQIELEMQNDELRRTQVELVSSQQRYFDLYDLAPVGYLTLDEAGLIIEANFTLCDMLGVSRQAVIKRPLSRFIHHEEQDCYYLFRKKASSCGEKTACETRLRKDEDSWFWAYLQATNTIDDGKMRLRMALVDISDRKKLEDEIARQEELMIFQSRQAAMGEMLSMIAHQWRQPLAVIAMEINNLQLDIDLKETITNEMITRMGDDVTEQVQYLSKTIDDFKDLLRPKQPKSTIQVTSIMEDALRIVYKSMENNNITVNTVFDSQTTIVTRPGELLQVFLNLLNNAKDALTETQQDDAWLTISITEDNEHIFTEIFDNGTGISEIVLHRLGEPYVSSKAESGTGLGIYMSKVIVEKHLKGRLTWENREGGACFTVTLPIHQDLK